MANSFTLPTSGAGAVPSPDAVVAGKTIEEGAATSCYVATAEPLGNISGQYFEDCGAVIVKGGHMHDFEMAARLMEVSEALTSDWLVDQERPDWSEFRNGIRGDRGEG